MKHFFFSKLDSRRCFRCLNSINFNKAETKLTSAGHHNTAAYAALSAGTGAAACHAVAHCRPPRATCQPLEKSRLFKHWLFSMVGWLTEAPHHRTRARMPPRRQTPRAPVVPVVSVLWYGSSCRARSPGKKLALQLFFLVNEKTNSFG